MTVTLDSKSYSRRQYVGSNTRTVLDLLIVSTHQNVALKDKSRLVARRFRLHGVPRRVGDVTAVVWINSCQVVAVVAFDLRAEHDGDVADDVTFLQSSAESFHLL